MMRKKLYLLPMNILFMICMLFTNGCFFATNDQNKEDNIDPKLFELDENKEYNIEFMMWGANNEINNYSALIDDFMDEYENITVSITTQDSTQFMSTLTGRLSGTMPDVFYLPEYEFRTWVDSGRLLSISNGMSEQDYEGIWNQAIDWYSYNRKTKQLGKSEGSNLYCLPKDIGPWTLMYNVDMIQEMVANNKLTLDEANRLKDTLHPLSWEEFTNICVKIQNYFNVEKGNDKFYALPYYELESALWSNNADYFDENAMHSTITTKEFKETIEWLYDLMNTYHVIPRSTGDSAQNMFLAKNSVFCWVGPYLTPMYHQEKMNYQLIPVPYNKANEKAKSTTWIGTLGLAISKTCKEPAAALALLKYLTINHEAQTDLVRRGQLMPNNKTMALSVTEFLAQQNELTSIWPESRSVYCDIVDGFSNETSNVLQNGNEMDIVGGRVRPHYYTFENSWLGAIQTEIAEMYGLKDKQDIAKKLDDFDKIMQGYLDKSNQSAGIQ